MDSTSGSFVDLHPGGFVESGALDAFEGQQVGTAWLYGGSHAMLWSGSTASAMDLHSPAYQYTSATAIGPGQQGGYGVIPSGDTFAYHALLWRGTAESIVDLHPEGYADSGILGVTGAYQVGYGYMPQQSGNRALMWTGSAESAVSLHPQGFDASFAFAADGDQQVGVGEIYSTGEFNFHALLWSGSAESAIDLHPVGYSLSDARGVRNGRQVGWGQSPTGRHALVWIGSAESVIDLHQFLPERFVGGHSVANGIDESRNIAGYAYDNRLEHYEAFIWVVPAPSTASIIGLGVTVAMRRRRSRG